jgi:uncharacterized protein YjbI with pentapeptide repeats
MATERELVERWSTEPGRAARAVLDELFQQPQWPDEPEEGADERGRVDIFELLQDLPFRSEVPSGRDFRGVTLTGGVRDLDLADADFSFATLDCNFVGCDLSRSRFDMATGEGVTIGNVLDHASFRNAKLRRPYFGNARATHCTFDGANLVGGVFEAADLEGSSFRGAVLKGVQLTGARVVGCDFRDAVLDEAVLFDLELDNSTDLRGASLLNVWSTDSYDHAGRLVARGTDLRRARVDLRTKFGEDPAAEALEILDQAYKLVSGIDGPQLKRLEQGLERERVRLAAEYDEHWWEHFVAQFDSADQPMAQALLERAVEALL